MPHNFYVYIFYFPRILNSNIPIINRIYDMVIKNRFRYLQGSPMAKSIYMREQSIY